MKIKYEANRQKKNSKYNNTYFYKHLYLSRNNNN